MMELQRLEGDFTVCKIENIQNIDFTREFVFLSKTDDEISLLCETDYVPPGTIAQEPGWKGLKISGILDFGMIGVISRISSLLADAGISVFVISTYNTDYIFVKAENFDKTTGVLSSHGYKVHGYQF